MYKLISFTILSLTILSCNNKSFISDMEFCQYGMLVPDMKGNFFFYKFYNKDYQIKVVVQDEGPDTIYIVEEGKYFVKDSNITFMPKTQLFFKQRYTNLKGLCTGLWIFEDTYYVNKDSLQQEEITKYKFNKRRVKINKNDNRMYITDPRYQLITVSNYCHK